MIKWLYDHYFITTLIALYYMALSGYATYQIFNNILAVTASSVAAYGTVMALPPAAIAMIRWRIGKDNE